MADWLTIGCCLLCLKTHAELLGRWVGLGGVHPAADGIQVSPCGMMPGSMCACALRSSHILLALQHKAAAPIRPSFVGCFLAIRTVLTCPPEQAEHSGCCRNGTLSSGGPEDSFCLIIYSLPRLLAKPLCGLTWLLCRHVRPRFLVSTRRDNQTGLAGICGITLAASYPVKNGPNPPEPKPDPKPDPKPTPKPPGPVMCDTGHACPPQSTCCCLDDKV
jgi:hypothetical protein